MDFDLVEQAELLQLARDQSESELRGVNRHFHGDAVPGTKGPLPQVALEIILQTVRDIAAENFLVAVVDDLKKMEAEPLIREAGLLLIVFTESNEVLEKDLQLFEDVLVRKEVLAGFRKVRSIPILDRMGHKLCTVALWPTIQR